MDLPEKLLHAIEAVRLASKRQYGRFANETSEQRDARLTSKKRYRDAHPESVKAGIQRWKNNLTEEERKAKDKAYHYLYRTVKWRFYGRNRQFKITREEYNELLDKQENRCAICNTSFEVRKQ